MDDKIIYIYEDHIYGDFYVSEEEIPYEDLYCETCNDSDSLVVYGTVKDSDSLVVYGTVKDILDKALEECKMTEEKLKTCSPEEKELIEYDLSCDNNFYDRVKEVIEDYQKRG